MSESSTSVPGLDPGEVIAQPAASPDTPSRLWARVMMIGGGLMAAWGALVGAGIVFVLTARDPGPEGPLRLITGGVVIGISPVLFGGIVCRMGLKRLRTIQAEEEAPSLATSSR